MEDKVKELYNLIEQDLSQVLPDYEDIHELSHHYVLLFALKEFYEKQTFEKIGDS